MKDYNISHVDSRKSTQYEEVIYKPGSYDDWQWQHEQRILRTEIDRLRAGQHMTRYLDFACGTGRILAFLEDDFATAVGVDISDTMLEYARTKVKKARLVSANILERDVLTGETYDCITAFRFFLNAGPELGDKAFLVLTTKLSRDGVFIFNIHGNIWSHRIFTKIWFMLRGRRLNTSSYMRVKNMLMPYHVRIVRSYGFGIVPKILYRILSPRILFAIDMALARVPLLKYISYNLIFVCQKNSV